MTIFGAFNLDILTYYRTLRDAIIYNNMQSKEGRKRLDDAWILEQDKPDRQALRENFGKE